MDRNVLLMLAGIVAGFALVRAPFTNTFLEGIIPVTNIIGVLAILTFSLYLIYKAIKAIVGK